MPGRDNRLYFMVFTGKEGGSKGQAPFCAGNGDSSEDSVWNAVVYDDTLDAENAVWRRFDGALAGGSWSCLFQPFIWHSVCGNGMDEKKGPVRERTSDRRNDRRIFYFVFYAGISYPGNFEGV